VVDTNFYDVVVCGGDLAGLLTGALLARRGFRVLIVGDGAEHAAFEARGVSLSRAPAVLPPLEAPPVARVLKELDVAAVVKRRAPVASALRVTIAHRKVDLGADLPALTSALGAGESALGPAIERLDAVGHLFDPLLAKPTTLPPHGFWERREVARLAMEAPRAGTDLLAPLAADHPFRTAVAAPGAAIAAFVATDVGMLAEARAFALGRQPASVFDCGLGGLQDLLLQRVETYGGDHRPGSQALGVLVRRGRVVGVRVSPRDETIGCHTLVWASDAAKLRVALGASVPGALFRGRAITLRVGAYRYGLALLVAPGAFSDPSPARIIAIADPTRPPIEDNAISITVGPPSGRTPDRIPVWVECTVPAHVVEGGPSYLGALRGRLKHALGRVFPSLHANLLLAASPFDGLPPEGSLPVPTNATKTPKLDPPLPPPLYTRDGATGPLDIFGLPHATGIKNLLLVGRENLPGMGLEGELVAGWGAARLMRGAPVRRAVSGRRTLISG
jgi:phytoene dehydrogenase-like protein